jgi:hypothetical protein
MKAYGEEGVYIHIFLTSALAGGEWSASCPGRFTPGTHWIGGWVGPRAGLDDVEKRKFLTLTGLDLRPLGCPARRQSLYRLRYPGSFLTLVAMKNSILWDMTPCCSTCCLLHACFLFGLLLDSEEGGDMFLRNVG